MQYLLDTNICFYLLKAHSARLVKKVMSFKPNELAVSMVSVAELMHGVSKSMRVEENRLALMKFLSPFHLLEFDFHDAMLYGEIESALRKKGTPIDPFDTLIAGQALARDYTLVTNDKHFCRISGLKFENWM